jgi:chaperonin GroES
MINPLHDLVVVKRVEKEESLIVLQDKEPSGMGEIVAVGTGRILEDGTVRPLDVKVGQTILFGKHTGAETGYDDLIIMREDDIFGVIDE